MNEMHTTIDRLETRIEDQAMRIDALYGLLELRGILPRGTDAGRGEGLFDDESEDLDLSSACDREPVPTMHAATRFRVGTATGV